MVGEVVGEIGRIKYTESRTGTLRLAPPLPPPLRQLAALMARLEACGMVPILDDGLVGGNCAIALPALGIPDAGCGGAGAAEEALGAGRGKPAAPAVGPPAIQPLAAAAGAWPEALHAAGGAILISRSGKAPGAALGPQDWVLLERFDAGAWSAAFRSGEAGVRPSSDAPLHAAALGPGAAHRYGWQQAPLVAVHGHALAEGRGLDLARRAGLPISERETLFSTPDDLHALEALFRSHPYPRHRCFIRRGHGFLLLASSVGEAEAYVQKHILPLMASGA